MMNIAAINWTLEVSRRWQLSQYPLKLKANTQVQRYVIDVLQNHDSSILKEGEEKNLCDLAILVGRLVAQGRPSAATLEKVKGFYMENFLGRMKDSDEINFIKKQVEAYANDHNLNLDVKEEDEQDLFDLEMEDDENVSSVSGSPPPPPPYSRFSSSDSFSSLPPTSSFKPVPATPSMNSSETVTPLPISSRSITPIVNESVEDRNKRLAENRAEINRSYARLVRQGQGISPLALWLQTASAFAPSPVQKNGEVTIEELPSEKSQASSQGTTSDRDEFSISL